MVARKISANTKEKCCLLGRPGLSNGEEVVNNKKAHVCPNQIYPTFSRSL